MAEVDQETMVLQRQLLVRRQQEQTMTSPRSSVVAQALPNLCKHCGATLARLDYFPSVTQPCGCDGAVAARQAEADAELERSLLTAAEQRLAREEKQAALIRRYQLGMPPKLRGCSFDNFEVLPHTREEFTAARALVDRNGAGRGLMLLGDVGVGKTHLAAAIANAEIAAGRSVLCGTVPDLLMRIKATFGSDTETEYQVMRPFYECSLLVLDDLGKEKPSAWVEEKVYMILNHRLQHDRRVVVTSNVGLTIVQMRYAFNGPAIVSRLFELCEGVNVKGPDYRRR